MGARASKMSDAVAKSLLEQLNGAGSATERRAAAVKLGKGRVQAAVPALMKAASEPRTTLKRACLEALTRIGDPVAMSVWLEHIDHADWGVRYAAAQGLGRLGDLSCLDALIRALDDESTHVVDLICRGLKRLGSSAEDAMIDYIEVKGTKDPYGREKVFEVLVALSSAKAVPSLTQIALDDEDSAQTYAIRCLGRSGAPEAIPALLALREHEDRYTRSHAAEALGAFREPSVVAALSDSLTDAEDSVRSAAAGALAEIAARRCSTSSTTRTSARGGRPRRVSGPCASALRFRRFENV